MTQRTLQLHAPPGLWPPTWPMGLTLLRLLLLPVFLWMVLIDAGGPTQPMHRHRFYALAIFAVMAATDKLDGYLARRLNQTSALGATLDPLADKLLIACSVILLSFEWVAPLGFAIPIWVVGAVYGKDLIVAAGTLALLWRLRSVNVRPRALGKLSTVLQLGMIMATLVARDLNRVRPALGDRLLPALWWGVTVVAVAACMDYVALGVRTYRAARRVEK